MMEEALQRLSKKQGVRGWLMLDRTTGAVLKTSGQIATIRPARANTNGSATANGAASKSGIGNNSNSNAANSTVASPSVATFSAAADGGAASANSNEMAAAREMGAMVWSFLGTSGSLVQEMDAEDELKLLRLRTKKQELVIVPEPKYVMVVIHDTPPA